MKNNKELIINYYERSNKVGIEQLDNNIINIYLPVGVTKNDVENDDNFIYKLLNSILPAKKQELELNDNLNSNTEEWPIYSEIWLVKDYIYHGLYKELEKKYNINIGGKINWKKTVNQESIYYNNTIYYPNIVHENNKNSYTIITELQKYCLNLCVVGKTICKLEEDNLNVNIIINNDNINYYINILNRELLTSFEDHKKQLLNSLINILKYYSSNNLTTINSFITYEYHYSWEYMISNLFGNNKSLLKELLPKSEYNPKEIGNYSSLIPDTVFSKDDSVFILDSKYYSNGNTPATSDICKQTEYCRTAKSKLNNNIYKRIFNSFILPSKVEEKQMYKGYANMISNTEETYKINIIYLDTLSIINMFYEGKKIQNIDFLKKNECII
ncbi:MAG: LlaJI family restriction endonuclease [Bacilli bacterium]|nr:LlaJI family restriction endonuclease [Bacilli bacterium]